MRMTGHFRGVIAVSLLTVLFLGLSPSVQAQDVWTAKKIGTASIPKEIVPEDQRPAPGGLPDALIETGPKPGDISAAWYAGRTNRYRHGILGDTFEGSILRVTTRAGGYLKLALPDTEVFEDRHPRLADLDGDGKTEIITIRTSMTHGAAVTVYGLRNGKLSEIATTEFIGRADRWLNIAGIASFRGGSGKEIAYVQTPHIGGTLFLYALEEGKLIKVGEKPGFSNHQTGSTEMCLSAIADINGDGAPDLAVPSADRRQLRIVGFNRGQLTDRGVADLPATIDKAIAVHGTGKATRFIAGLQSGEVYSVGR